MEKRLAEQSNTTLSFQTTTVDELAVGCDNNANCAPAMTTELLDASSELVPLVVSGADKGILATNSSALAAPTFPTCSTNCWNHDVSTCAGLTPTVTASTTLELGPDWDWGDVYAPLAELRQNMMTDEKWAAMSDWEKVVWDMKHRPEWERLA